MDEGITKACLFLLQAAQKKKQINRHILCVFFASQAPSLTHGGTSWFTDITVPDAYYGLPVLCTLTTLAMVQYGINITGESMDTQKASECLACAC